MKIKKIVALALTAVMLFALTACGGSSSNTTTGSSEGQTTASGGGTAKGTEYNWTAGNVLAADQPWDMGLKKFGELLNEYSDGRMSLTVQSGGVLGQEIDMIDAVQMGTLDFAICSTPSMSGFVDSQNYFDLPYLFKSVASAWEVMDSWLAKDRCDALTGTGFKGLGYFENGTYMVASKTKVEHPADMKNLRVRSHSSKMQSRAFEVIGASPVTVAWGDIYTSLQQGTIDAVSGTTLTNMYGGKFYEQVDYITMTNHHFIPSLVVMNEDLWNSLSAEDQEIVQKAFDEAVTYQRQVAYDYAAECKTNIEASGVEIIDVDADEWSEAMHPVYDEYVGTNGIEQSMIDKIQQDEAQYLK